jgi:Zn-dependent peptidase ImmA (M78 family)/transcriptional regulator with XRE-family HTH domain
MNGDRLKRAREIKGWTQAELAAAVKRVSQAAIARIEQNLLEPSEQLEQQIALATGFPLSFFHQETVVDFPAGSLLFRQHRTLPSRERAQVLQTAWAAYILYDHLAQRLKVMPLRLPRIENESAHTAALMTRNALGVEPNVPIRDLIRKLEKAGVVVVAIPLEIHGHDAFSLWADNRRAVMILSWGKPGDRQRHTAAHEAGHLVQHHVPAGNQDDLEDEAEAFAGELLLPEEAMREEITKPVTLSSLAELKPRWGVSIGSLIERAYQLRIITVDQRKYLWRQMNLKGWKQQEPKNLEIEPEKPRALKRMAELRYGDKDGTINLQSLSRDTSLPAWLIAQVLDVHADYGKENNAPAPAELGQLRHFPKKETLTEDDEAIHRSVG